MPVTTKYVPRNRRGQVELQQQKDQLLQQKEFFSSILERTPQPFRVSYPDGRLGFFNTAFQQITGYTAEELKSMDWRKTLIPPEWREIEQKKLDELQRTGQPVRYETEHIRKDGSRVFLESLVHLVTDADQRPQYYCCFLIDLTERKRAEEALHTSAEFNRCVLENSFDCIKILDTEGRLLYMSPGGWRLLEWVEQELPEGTSWLDMWHGTHREQAVEAVAIARAGGTGTCETFCHTASGAPKWWDTIITPIRDANGNVVRLLSISRDITEQKQAQRALLSSEKLAVLGRMAASIAHEINNPLEAVINLLYLAQTNLNAPGTVRNYLEIAQQEMQRVAHITRQTLGFYRERSAPTAISVNSVLGSAVDLLKGKIKVKNATVLAAQSADNLQAMAVPGELRQIFSNLLANSLDAIEAKGTIRLRVSRSTCPHSGYPRVRITIADNGKGINATTLPHIFEPLFTTKEKTGSGLGLWVSKQLVEKHGGYLAVRSNTGVPHRGTTFSVVIPQGRQDARASVALAK